MGDPDVEAAHEQEDRSSGVQARLADALQIVSADRDRLQAVVQGSLIAIETILMGDHVDLGVGSGVILGRVSLALKRALDGETLPALRILADYARDLEAERDRLRAIVAEHAQGIMPTIELVAGTYEFPLGPGLSTRFSYCPVCRMVWPPGETDHECQVDESETTDG